MKNVDNDIRWIIVVILLVLWRGLPDIAASASQTTANELTPRQFKALLDQRGNDSNIVLLDVRTPGEFKMGHIQGAQLIDFYSRDFETRLKALNRDNTYLLYCRSGNRSGKSLSIFKRLGFRQFYHLNGGLIEWTRAKYPLVN